MSSTTHPTGWRKSSHSTNNNDCVEVARTGTCWAVRDSKHPGGGHLTVSATAWEKFTNHIKRDAYDL